MRRWPVLAALVPLAAAAGWVTIPASGLPSDIVAVDAGVIVFSSKTSGTNGIAVAWTVLPDGGFSTIGQVPVVANYVGAGLFGGTCVVGYDLTGLLHYSTAGCGTDGTPTGGYGVGDRYRVGPSGSAYALSWNTSVVRFSTSSAPATLTSYAPPGLDFIRASSPYLTTLSAGAQELGFFNATGLNKDLCFSVDAGAYACRSVGATGDLRTFAPFATGTAIRAIVTPFSSNGLFLTNDVRAVSPLVPTAVSFPPNLTISAVAFTLVGGGPAGAGFGLLTGDGGLVASPIPNPARPGETWVLRAGAPPLSTYVSCSSAAFCAAAGNGAVYAYFNQAAPFVDVPGGVTLLDGTAVDLVADAGDLDGDPVFITWASDGGVNLSTDAGDGRSLRLAAPAGLATCQPLSFSLSATVSDGLDPHARTFAFPVTVTRAQSVAVPSVSPVSVALAAGSGPQAFLASFDGGCAPTSYAWTTSDSLAGGSSSFNWTPPPLVCTADGGLAWVEVRTQDATTTSAPARANIRLLPSPLGALSVTPAVPVVSAGGTPVPFQVELDGGCAPASYVWTSSAGSTGSAATYAFVPPATVCSADAGAAWVQVVASDLNFTSAPVRLNFQIPATPLATPLISPATAAPAADAGAVSFQVSYDGGCAPSSFTWSSSTDAGGTGTSFSWPTPALACGAAGAAAWVEVRATDGTSTTGPSRANITLAPSPMASPVISPAAVTVAAGASAVQFTAVIDGGCAPTSFSWISSDGQDGGGATFGYLPPRVYCELDAGTVVLTMQGFDGTSSSTPVKANVLVLPWGAPEAPVFDAGASQRAGPPVDWLPVGADHACTSATGFPGTSLAWSSIDAGPGLSATPIDGGLRVATADRCSAGTVSATAQRLVSGSTAPPSAPGVLVVSVSPDPPPIGAGTGFSLGFVPDSGARPHGVLSTDAGCASSRPLTARLVVVGDGGVYASPPVQPLGSWSAPFIAPCEGGRFMVLAELLEDGGTTGVTAAESFDLPGRPVTLEGVDVSPFEVRCGAPTQGLASVRVATGSCATPAVDWRFVSGARVTFDGGVVTVAPDETGWSLLGRVTKIEASAAGDASGAKPGEIRYVAAPFLAITSRVVPSPAREEEPAQVRVSVSNPTLCAAEGVEVRLSLSSLSPIEGSATVDGVPVPLTREGDLWLFGGVSLPASGGVELRFKARVPVLGRPGVVGAAWLGSEKVSVDATPPAGAGCGCGAAPGAGWVALVFIAGLRRRRILG